MRLLWLNVLWPPFYYWDKDQFSQPHADKHLRRSSAADSHLRRSSSADSHPLRRTSSADSLLRRE